MKSCKQTIYRECKDCGQRFPIYGGEQEYAEQHPDEYALPVRCHKCRELRKQVEMRECIECGCSFGFTASEKKFYASRNLNEPKRCPECRRKKRVESNGSK